MLADATLLNLATTKVVILLAMACSVGCFAVVLMRLLAAPFRRLKAGPRHLCAALAALERMENGKCKMGNVDGGWKMGVQVRKNVVAEKSMSFAVRVVKLYRHLVDEKREYVMSKQALRSGTSIGANVREATSAQSKADFVSKCAIALKECDETGYWLELLSRTEFLSCSQYESLETDRRELFALLTTIIKTAKASMKQT